MEYTGASFVLIGEKRKLKKASERIHEIMRDVTEAFELSLLS